MASENSTVSTVLSTKPKSVSDETKISENVVRSKMEHNENGEKHVSEQKGCWKSICCSLVKFLISLALLIFSSLFFSLNVVDLHYEMNGLGESTVKNYIDFPKNVTFPAITICNNNRVQKTKLCEKMQEFCSKIGLNITAKRRPHIDFHFLYGMPASELAEWGQSFSDLVEDCFLIDGDKDNQVCVVGSRIYSHPSINCFTFLTNNNSLRGDYRKTGVSLNVNFQPEEYTEAFVRVGGRLYLHDEKERLPINPNGFLHGYPLKPGFSYKIAMKKTTYHRLPPPYETGCKDYSKYSEGASQKECYNECLIKTYTKRCGCQPRFVAYAELRERHINCNYSWNTPSGICFHSNEKEFGELCDELCPITCDEDRYEAKIEEQETPTSNSELRKDEESHSRILIQYETNEHKTIYYTVDEDKLDVKCGMLFLRCFLILFLMWLTFKTAKQLCRCSKQKKQNTGSGNSVLNEVNIFEK